MCPSYIWCFCLVFSLSVRSDVSALCLTCLSFVWPVCHTPDLSVVCLMCLMYVCLYVQCLTCQSCLMSVYRIWPISDMYVLCLIWCLSHLMYCVKLVLSDVSNIPDVSNLTDIRIVSDVWLLARRVVSDVFALSVPMYVSDLSLFPGASVLPDITLLPHVLCLLIYHGIPECKNIIPPGIIYVETIWYNP